MKELNVNYDAKIVRSGKQHVKCKYEDRAKVRAWCTANNVQGITSTCSHERIGASVVKGIPIDYTPEEVKDYLEELVDFKIDKVRRFAEPREGVRPFHWWVINTATKDQAKELSGIKFFNERYPIKWEAYTSKRCPRCYNCQEYKHLARNCFKEPRCSKCRTRHSPLDCTRPDPGPNTSKEELASYWCHPCQKRHRKVWQ